MNPAVALALGSVAVGLMAVPVKAAQPEPWTIVFITYRDVDADCQGAHVHSSLSDDEYATALTVQRQMVALVNAWNPQIRLTATYVTRQMLDKLFPIGSGCWPGTGEVPPAGTFDSTYVMADPLNDLTGQWWYPAAGLSPVCGQCYWGGTYATSVAWSEFGTTWERNVVLNEWLHGTSEWYRTHGAYVANPEEGGKYGYVGEQGDVFYHALIGGKLADLNHDGHPDSITPWHQRIAGTPH